MPTKRFSADKYSPTRGGVGGSFAAPVLRAYPIGDCGSGTLGYNCRRLPSPQSLNGAHALSDSRCSGTTTPPGNLPLKSLDNSGCQLGGVGEMQMRVGREHVFYHDPVAFVPLARAVLNRVGIAQVIKPSLSL